MIISKPFASADVQTEIPEKKLLHFLSRERKLSRVMKQTPKETRSEANIPHGKIHGDPQTKGDRN